MLDLQVGQLIDEWKHYGVRTSTTHFVNLSRGLLVGVGVCISEKDLDYVTPVRIPSTWCEQKHWGRILETLSPVLWTNMALGDTCVVHDISEKPRQTRAMWQGLSWIRYATRRAWGLEVVPELSRSGMCVDPYWEHVYHGLPSRTVNVLKYYQNFHLGTSFELVSCPTCDKGTTK